MASDWGLDPKTLASEFNFFIKNPKTLGGSYSITSGENHFIYQIGSYGIEGTFLNKNKCRVKVTNESSIEDTLKVAYIHATEPDFQKLFTEICGLAKKLTDSK